MSFFSRKKKESSLADAINANNYRNGTTPQQSNGGSASPYDRQEKPYNEYGDDYDSRSNASNQPPSYSRTVSQGQSQRGSYDDYERNEKVKPQTGRFGDPPGRRLGEADRSELFSGYKPADPQRSIPSNRFADGPSDQFGQPGRQRQRRPPSPTEGGDEEEGTKWYQQATVDTLQDSSSSLARSRRLLGQTLETADATLNKLDQQTEKFDEIENALGKTHLNARDANNKVKQLKFHDRSIFRPAFMTSGEGRATEEEIRKDRILFTQEEEERKQKAMQEKYGDYSQEEQPRRAAAAAAARPKRAGRFAAFNSPAGDEADQLEDGIDDQLNDIEGMLGQLKMKATAMGTKVEGHNQTVGRLGDQVDLVDQKVNSAAAKLKRFK